MAVVAKMPSSVRFLRFTNAFAIISIFAIGAMVYGPYASRLGFYYDDWPVIWIYKTFGPQGVFNYFAGERPLFGWMIAHLIPILGVFPRGWQVLAIVIRCASSAAVFVAFGALWPRRKDVAWLVGVLVLVYPGFTQQPIALTYISHHLSFLLFVCSLATTILAITNRSYRWLFFAISLVTAVASYLLIEYFLGLELFRLLVIIVLARRESQGWTVKSLRKAIVHWSPFAAVWAVIIVRRTFFFHAQSYYGVVNPKDGRNQFLLLLTSPIRSASIRIFGALHNILVATILSWARPFSPNLIDLNSRAQFRSLAIAAVVAAIVIYMVRLLTVSAVSTQALESSEDKPLGFGKEALLLGLAGLVVADLPFALSGVLADFGPHPSFFDRFTLPFVLAASLILVVFLVSLGATLLSRVLVVSLIFAFSAFQVQDMSLYRQDWELQRSLFWQIAWRAPALKPGSCVFIDGMPRSLYSNHSAGMLDLLYNRTNSAGRLNYFIFDLEELALLKTSYAATQLSYKPGDPIYGRVHIYQFQGTPTPSLVAWLSPNGILRIVTENDTNEILRGSALPLSLSHLSQPDEIINDLPGSPNGPLTQILGPEPEHDWSYYYQKAELERQLKHWDVVAALGDEVRKEGYSPKDFSEWFPFIDGYTRAHRYRTAADLSLEVLDNCPDALEALSSLWLRVKHEDSQNSAELSSAFDRLGPRLVLQKGQI
jgi:hypothetical protein